MIELDAEDRLQFKVTRIEGAISNGICYMCDEEIDFTDGDLYVLLKVRVNRPTLRFHLDCFSYLLQGMNLFETYVVTKTPKTLIQ